jgi:hypothetical protein
MRPRPIAIVGAAAAAAPSGAAMVIASKHRQFRRSTEADVHELFSLSETSVGRLSSTHGGTRFQSRFNGT